MTSSRRASCSLGARVARSEPDPRNWALPAARQCESRAEGALLACTSRMSLRENVWRVLLECTSLALGPKNFNLRLVLRFHLELLFVSGEDDNETTFSPRRLRLSSQ